MDVDEKGDETQGHPSSGEKMEVDEEKELEVGKKDDETPSYPGSVPLHSQVLL